MTRFEKIMNKTLGKTAKEAIDKLSKYYDYEYDGGTFYIYSKKTYEDIGSFFITGSDLRAFEGIVSYWEKA